MAQHLLQSERGCATFEDDTEVELIPFGNEERFEPPESWLQSIPGYPAVSRCWECGVAVGTAHGLGCTVEECPACREMYIFCSCRTDEKQTYYNWLVNRGTIEEIFDAKHISG